jgi:rare lipoprotein A (peptidoglycan hydrolase)
VKHFDVSYDAFEQLAHPVYGVAMIEYRTVDCDCGAPLAEGYIDRQVTHHQVFCNLLLYYCTFKET